MHYVVPCLSSGLTKINKIISMFVLFFPGFLTILKVWLFFSKNGGVKPHTKAVKQDDSSQFLKVQQLSQFFKKTLGYLENKVRTNLTLDGCRRLFNEKLCFCGKHCGFFDYFLGTKVTTLMCV